MVNLRLPVDPIHRRATLAGGAFALLALASLAPSCVDSSEEITALVADFRGDARGAYTLIHDDLCAYGTDGVRDHALVELDLRELRAGFGAIAGQCRERDYWPTLADAISHGHEIVNHTMNHPSLLMDRDYAMEMDAAKALVERKVAGAKLTFFIFPYDEFDDEAVDYLRQSGYLGARAGIRGLNAPMPSDPLRLNFDVYGPDYSIYQKEFESGSVTDILSHHVAQAIEKHAWAIREVHGVDDASWESVPIDAYRAHLDYVKKRVDSGELWMDTPTAITRYTQTHRLCGTPVVEGHTLRFQGKKADCEKFKTTLSVKITSLDGITGLSARQGDVVLATRGIDQYTALIDGVDPSLETQLDLHGAFNPGSSLGGAASDSSGGSSSRGSASGGSASGGADGGAPAAGGALTGGAPSLGGAAPGGSTGMAGTGGA